MLVTYSNLGKGCMFVCVSAKQAHYQTDPWFLLQILWGGRMRLEGKAVDYVCKPSASAHLHGPSATPFGEAEVPISCAYSST